MDTPELVSCGHCRRHYFAATTDDGGCPFCSGSRSARPRPGNVARFAMAAMTPMVLGACYGSPYKDSGDTGFGPDDTGTSDIIGPISGTAGVFILEAECDVVWDLSGSQCAGCDLAWDVSLELNELGSCAFGDSTAGVFEVREAGVYFSDQYWGAAQAGGGTVTWASNGYVYGEGGGNYLYSGSATY